VKKNYILPLFLLAVAGLSWQKTSIVGWSLYHQTNKLNAGGSPAGKTGAPNEASCTDCHSGSVLNGATENLLLIMSGMSQVTKYVPGTTYTVTLAMASNPTKKGFQATVLDGSNNMAGSFIAGITTSINGSSRKYANHKSISNTSASPAWQWQWTAPSTDVGEVTFYVATNKANNNGKDSGDEIYLSQHKISSDGNAIGLDEQKLPVYDFNAAFDALKNQLSLNFHSLNTGSVTLNLVDMNGKSVYFGTIGSAMIGENTHFIQLPTDVTNGLYVAHLFVNNSAGSKKLYIQR
jgi:hypothetical protein